jgi:hypothetical protein
MDAAMRTIGRARERARTKDKTRPRHVTLTTSTQVVARATA